MWEILVRIRIALGIIGGIAGIIALYRFFILRPWEIKPPEKIVEEKLKEIVSVPSPLQDGVMEFVPKDEFEFGNIMKEADSLFHQGSFKEAESLYNKAYEIARNSKKGKLLGLALLGMGATKREQGNYEEAIRRLKEGLKYKKEIKDSIAIGRIYFNLGYCYQFTQRLKEAIKNYNKAIELNPKYADAFNNRGVAHSDKGEYDKAIEDYNKAIELNPKLALAFYNRGFVYRNKGELDKAIADYNKAIELNPKLAETMEILERAYQVKGDKEKAATDTPWYRDVALLNFILIVLTIVIIFLMIININIMITKGK